MSNLPTSHGRGGAGNVRPDDLDATTDTASPAHVTDVSGTSAPVSHGRGGAGNIVTEDLATEDAQASATAETHVASSEAVSHGRGGAGNITTLENAAQTNAAANEANATNPNKSATAGRGGFISQYSKKFKQKITQLLNYLKSKKSKKAAATGTPIATTTAQ